MYICIYIFIVGKLTLLRIYFKENANNPHKHGNLDAKN